MTGVQAQAAKLLEQIKSMSFSAARRSGHHLDIGKMEVLQMALEKQVPQKPGEIDRDLNYFVCPRCGTTINSTSDLEDIKYCLECGQAIDWRD